MLKKLFIKDYLNVNDNKVREKYGFVAGMFGIITNLLLGLTKLIIGFISKSVSIMADATNNLSDCINCLLTIFGFKLSNKKPTKEHPYGFARIEYVSGLIISIIMLIMGLIFVKESIIKIISKELMDSSLLIIIILFLAIIIKFIQMYIYNDYSKAINSSTLKANAIDTRNDILSTTAILISTIINYYFNINLDGYIALLVSILVIISSINTIKEVIEPIIGIKPTEEYIKEIETKLLSYDVVIGIHDLLIHNYGTNNNFVTVHCEVDSKSNLVEIHDLIDNIEREFKEQLGILLTIHMDPIELGNKKVDKLKKEIVILLKKLDKEITIHDFRIVDGNTHTNVLFDIVIPYDKDYDLDYIIKYLKTNIKYEEKKYYYVIEIDRPFV